MLDRSSQPQDDIPACHLEQHRFPAKRLGFRKSPRVPRWACSRTQGPRPHTKPAKGFSRSDVVLRTQSACSERSSSCRGDIAALIKGIQLSCTDKRAIPLQQTANACNTVLLIVSPALLGLGHGALAVFCKEGCLHGHRLCLKSIDIHTLNCHATLSFEWKAFHDH